jgi:hypothetical protein
VREHLLTQLKSIGVEVNAADAGDRVLHSEPVECGLSGPNRRRANMANSYECK